jgi:hypothetical protein
VGGSSSPPADLFISADEKTRLQARRRKQPTLAGASGRPMRVEHEHLREGAWTYLAAGVLLRSVVLHSQRSQRLIDRTGCKSARRYRLTQRVDYVTVILNQSTWLVDVLAFGHETLFGRGQVVSGAGPENVECGPQDHADQQFHDQAAHDYDGERTLRV